MEIISLVSIDEKILFKTNYSIQLYQQLSHNKIEHCVIYNNINDLFQENYEIDVKFLLEDVLDGRCTVEKVIYQVSKYSSVIFTKTNPITKSEIMQNYNHLNQVISSIRDTNPSTEFLFIDCQSSLNNLSLNAMILAKVSIFFMVYDYYSLEVLEHLVRKIYLKQPISKILLLSLDLRLRKEFEKKSLKEISKIIPISAITKKNQLYIIQMGEIREELMNAIRNSFLSS